MQLEHTKQIESFKEFQCWFYFSSLILKQKLRNIFIIFLFLFLLEGNLTIAETNMMFFEIEDA